MNQTPGSTRHGQATQSTVRGGPLRSATRRAEELLVRRGLYPFEFRVTISPVRSDGYGQPYSVKIEASDGDLFVEKAGVPLAWIERCMQGRADDFDRFIDSLLTELLAKIG